MIVSFHDLEPSNAADLAAYIVFLYLSSRFGDEFVRYSPYGTQIFFTCVA